MGKVFIVDQALCNGCYGCQIACKDETVGNEWPPYSKSQPVTGQFWCKMLQKDHGQVPKVCVEYKPTFCNHCDGAPCMAAFPDAVYKRDDGLVIIDPEKAAGARGLVEACPYGAVYWNEELELPQKCTGCAHLVDEGKVPHCVDVCVTGALRFGDEEDFAEEIAAAEVVPAFEKETVARGSNVVGGVERQPVGLPPDAVHAVRLVVDAAVLDVGDDGSAAHGAELYRLAVVVGLVRRGGPSGRDVDVEGLCKAA